MSGANDSAGVSGEENVTEEVAQPDPHAHDPHIKVLRGAPTDAGTRCGGRGRGGRGRHAIGAARAEENLWGHPVDRLRYTTFSWQRVTLLERTHMRK